MSSSQGVNADTLTYSGYLFSENSIRDASDWVRRKREARVYTNYKLESAENKVTEPVWMKYGNDFRLGYNFGRLKCDECTGNAFTGFLSDSNGVPPPAGNGLTYQPYVFDETMPSNKPSLLDNLSTWGNADYLKLGLAGFSGLGTGNFIPYFYDGAPGAMNDYNYVAIYMYGFFYAPVSGDYVFTISSDDGFQMAINPGNLIYNEPGCGNSNGGTSTPITLVAGQKYPFDALWSNGTGAMELVISDITVNGQSLPNDLGIPIYSCFYTYD